MRGITCSAEVLPVLRANIPVSRIVKLVLEWGLIQTFAIASGRRLRGSCFFYCLQILQRKKISNLCSFLSFQYFAEPSSDFLMYVLNSS